MSFNSLCDFKGNNYVVSSAFALSEFPVAFFCPVFPLLLWILHVVSVRLNDLYQVAQCSTTLSTEKDGRTASVSLTAGLLVLYLYVHSWRLY